ncbi:hypothetical protein KEM52_006511 [Ascosphaera acerosa]|nr:hypothetical protein KEM52_006511 [Ascosphaera acerosa]
MDHDQHGGAGVGISVDLATSASHSGDAAPGLAAQPTTGTMDTDMDMDIDIDIDLGPEPEPGPATAAVANQHIQNLETEPVLTAVYPSTRPADAGAAPAASADEATPEKVHIRGVDELTTDDIKAFAREHFAEELPAKIEWIDDTSANIVYSSAQVGLRALAAFSQNQEQSQQVHGSPQLQESLRLRLAKSLSTHPDSVLQVRTAVASDKKRARAHEASRFYLLHPEHDPRERERLRQRPRSRGRRRGARRDRSMSDHDDDDDDDYHRRRFDDREHRRRLDDLAGQNLAASMYDDDGGAGDDDADVDMDGAAGARGRNGRDRRRRGGRPELSPDDSPGSSRLRRRGRSTSPMADAWRGDVRDRSPRSSRRDDRARNRGKELFATPSGTATATAASAGLDSGSSTSFLKGNAAAVSRHRRSGAFDAADATADLSRRLSASEASTPKGRPASRAVELFPEHTDAPRLQIKGSGSVLGQDSDRGFTINGAAAAARGVRELFPSKFNPNEGKELFSDTIKGRGGRRRRAEDMFA